MRLLTFEFRSDDFTSQSPSLVIPPQMQ